MEQTGTAITVTKLVTQDIHITKLQTIASVKGQGIGSGQREAALFSISGGPPLSGRLRSRHVAGAVSRAASSVHEMFTNAC